MIKKIDLISSTIKLLIALTYDLLAISIAFFLSYFIRIGLEGVTFTWPVFSVYIFLVLTTLLLFYFSDVYHSVVRFFNAKDFLKILSLLLITCVAFYFYAYIFDIFLPRSVPIVFLVLASIAIPGARAIIALLVEKQWLDEREGVVIYGASSAGRQLVEALSLGKKYQPLAFIDEKSVIKAEVF